MRNLQPPFPTPSKDPVVAFLDALAESAYED